MDNEELIQLVGTVAEILPDTLYRVLLPNGHVVFGHISAKMRKDLADLVIGDKVRLEISPYDLGKARILSMEK